MAHSTLIRTRRPRKQWRHEYAETREEQLREALNLLHVQKRTNYWLYRCAAEHSANDRLRAQYAAFRDEIERQLAILDAMQLELGYDPTGTSLRAIREQVPGQRLLETLFDSDSLDAKSKEYACLAAVLLAEIKDQENWQALKRVAAQLPVGETKRLLSTMLESIDLYNEAQLRWADATWQRAIIRGL